jgi:leucyl/phenylalanyl-tRNA--protein transferase
MRAPKPPSSKEEHAQRVVDIFLKAYAHGAFPMADPPPLGLPSSAHTINWYCPDPRAIFPLSDNAFHIPDGLKRPIKRCPFVFTSDLCFTNVLRACAEPTPARPDTWLDDTLIACYSILYERAHAHSIEAWLPPSSHTSSPTQKTADDPTPRVTEPPPGSTLVGGIYGVSIGAAFFAESMFCRPDIGGSHSSNLALLTLWHHLRRCNYQVLDVQIANHHTVRFGVTSIPQSDYLSRLAFALAAPDAWRPLASDNTSPAQASPPASTSDT